MTITKVEKGKHTGEWKVRIQPRDPATGKQISVPIQYAAKKTDAVKIERKMKADVESGLTYADANKVFCESFRIFVERQHSDGYWENSTYRDWLYTASILDEYFPKVKIRAISESLIRQFARNLVHDRHLTVGRDSVVDRRLSHMRRFFSPLIGESIKKNPVPNRALDKFFKDDEKSLKKKKYILTDTEIEALKRTIKDDLVRSDVQKWVTKLAIWLDLETGMRPQEIQGVKWKNFQLENGYKVLKIDDAWNQGDNRLNGHLKARKKGEYRTTLPITAELNEYFLLYRKKQQNLLNEAGIVNSNDFVFLNLNDYRICGLGRPVKQASLNEMLVKLGNRVGIKPQENEQWSMYSLRHTVATKLGNTPEMSYPWAAARMGHTVQEFMQTYLHVDQDRVDSMLDKWTAGHINDTQIEK